MKSLSEVIESKENLVHSKPLKEEVIKEAEEKLSLKFSRDYYEYTLRYGAISYLKHELTGVTGFPEDDVVEITLGERLIHPEIPNDWYVIERAGIDDIVFWQDRDGAIYQGKKKICNNLLEYIDK